MTTTMEIYPGESVRYHGPRHTWNNGFRRRWLDRGLRHADAINAARRGDFGAVLAHADTLPGLTQRRSWMRSAIAAARKLESDIPAYRIHDADGRRYVEIPELSWQYRGPRQVAYIRWIPMWTAPART